ncbi:MAG: hypothetical protein AAGH15_16305 [Myxococcota bacterium]
MSASLRALAFAFVTLVPALAAADVQTLGQAHVRVRPAPKPLSHLELFAGLGITGRATSGTPTGHRHDYGYAPMTEAGARFLFGDHEAVALGFMTRGYFFQGPGFGRRGYGFRTFGGDLVAAGRFLFPCMSGSRHRVYFGSSLGLSGAYLDAGLGVGGNNEGLALRRAAARELDHGALGFVFGVDLAVHVRGAFVGVGIDTRQLFGLRTPAARTTMNVATLRVGWALDRRYAGPAYEYDE